MQAAFLSRLLDVKHMRVYSTRRERREKFTGELATQLGVDVEPCANGGGAAVILVAEYRRRMISGLRGGNAAPSEAFYLYRR
jgi:hypothetical protein